MQKLEIEEMLYYIKIKYFLKSNEICLIYKSLFLQISFMFWRIPNF